MRAGRRADALLAFEDAAVRSKLPSTPWSGTAARIERSAADCCSNLARRAASRAISRGRGQPCWRQPKPRTNFGLVDVMVRAAVAYEVAMWRFSYAADRPVPRQLLERVLRALPPTETAMRVQVEGALARALLHSGAEEEDEHRAPRESRSPANSVTPRYWRPRSRIISLDFVWGPTGSRKLSISPTKRWPRQMPAAISRLPTPPTRLRFQFELRLGNIAAADAEVEALMRLDQRIRQATYSNAALAYDATLAILRGRLDQAERDYLRIATQLRQTGQAEQLGIQMFTLRREQGRLAELGPVVAQFVQEQTATTIWRPGLAVLYLEMGQIEDARRAFQESAAHDFADLPRDGRWLFCMVYLSEVCEALGDAARAASSTGCWLPMPGKLSSSAAACRQRLGRPLSRRLSATMSGGPRRRAFRGGAGDERANGRPRAARPYPP